MLNMGYFFAGAFAKRAMEDQQLTMAEDDAGADEGRMARWLSVKDP